MKLIKISFLNRRSWVKFLNDIKKVTLNSLGKHELKECIEEELFQGDEFHPNHSEYDLSEIIQESQEFESLSDAKEELEEVFRAMVDEIQENIEEYYSNEWNFPPEEEHITKIKIKFKRIPTTKFRSLLKYLKFKVIKQ